jgi:hypothetical protein
LIARSEQSVDISRGPGVQPQPGDDRLSDVSTDDGRADCQQGEGRKHGANAAKAKELFMKSAVDR